MKIIVATSNIGKIREIEQLCKGLPIEFVPLSSYPGRPVVVEDGASYFDNAIKKAQTIARFVALPALAEDSGIEIDALGGRPGIYSARYAGEGATDLENNRKLLEELKGIPLERRTARYRASVVLADAKSILATAEGTCEGIIAESPRGETGFGYDPLFVPHGYGGRTMAELGLEIKNGISHRAVALAKIRDDLRRFCLDSADGVDYGMGR